MKDVFRNASRAGLNTGGREVCHTSDDLSSCLHASCGSVLLSALRSACTTVSSWRRPPNMTVQHGCASVSACSADLRSRHLGQVRHPGTPKPWIAPPYFMPRSCPVCLSRTLLMAVAAADRIGTRVPHINIRSQDMIVWCADGAGQNALPGAVGPGFRGGGGAGGWCIWFQLIFLPPFGVPWRHAVHK